MNKISLESNPLNPESDMWYGKRLSSAKFLGGLGVCPYSGNFHPVNNKDVDQRLGQKIADLGNQTGPAQAPACALEPRGKSCA